MRQLTLSLLSFFLFVCDVYAVEYLQAHLYSFFTSTVTEVCLRPACDGAATWEDCLDASGESIYTRVYALPTFVTEGSFVYMPSGTYVYWLSLGSDGVTRLTSFWNSSATWFIFVQDCSQQYSYSVSSSPPFEYHLCRCVYVSLSLAYSSPCPSSVTYTCLYDMDCDGLLDLYDPDPYDSSCPLQGVWEYVGDIVYTCSGHEYTSRLFRDQRGVCTDMLVDDEGIPSDEELSGCSVSFVVSTSTKTYSFDEIKNQLPGVVFASSSIFDYSSFFRTYSGNISVQEEQQLQAFSTSLSSSFFSDTSSGEDVMSSIQQYLSSLLSSDGNEVDLSGVIGAISAQTAVQAEFFSSSLSTQREGFSSLSDQLAGIQLQLRQLSQEGEIPPTPQFSPEIENFSEESEREGLKRQIYSLFDNVLPSFSPPQISVADAVCTVEGRVGKWDVSFSFCAYQDFFSFLGDVLLGLSALFSVLIVSRR